MKLAQRRKDTASLLCVHHTDTVQRTRNKLISKLTGVQTSSRKSFFRFRLPWLFLIERYSETRAL